jgi:hypothetical protein
MRRKRPFAAPLSNRRIQHHRSISFTELELAGRRNDHPTRSRRTGCFFVSTSDVRVVRNDDPVAEPAGNLANVG